MSFIVGPKISLPDPEALVPGSVTGSIAFVTRYATGYEQFVLNALWTMTRKRHRYTEVKIRCKKLLPGQPACHNPRPHFDSTMDFKRDGRPEVHHLFTTPPTTVFHVLDENLDAKVVNVPEGYAVSYGRFSLHQAPAIRQPCMRLMIRISETDYIRPRNVVEGR